MLADFSATLAAFKTALQSLKAIQEAKTGEQVRIRTAELNLIVLDLQEKLSTLYAQNLTLQSRNAELERKIRDIEQQRAHLSRYELHRHEAGGLVYRHEQDIATRHRRIISAHIATIRESNRFCSSAPAKPTGSFARNAATNLP